MVWPEGFPVYETNRQYINVLIFECENRNLTLIAILMKYLKSKYIFETLRVVEVGYGKP